MAEWVSEEVGWIGLRKAQEAAIEGLGLGFEEKVKRGLRGLAC